MSVSTFSIFQLHEQNPNQVKDVICNLCTARMRNVNIKVVRNLPF